MKFQIYKKKTEVIAGRLCNVLPIAYLSRNELASTISKASVAMMLSFHEGFGLVGYEAIAAGVPLILSKNTGLYAFLEREGFLKWVYPVEIRGSTEETGYSEADLRNVAIALRIIRLNETQYKEKALILRDQLRSKEKYTWDGVAQRFIESVHTQFETELDRENTAFYRPEQMTKLNFPAGKKTDEITHIIIPEGNHTFVVSGKDALISLYFSVKDHFGENYSVLLYDVPAQMEESCFYSDFLNDCRSFFGKEQDYKGHEFKYQLAERLNQTILIINNYTLTSCSPFFDLLGLLNKSKYNFNIFIVNENDDAPLTLITYDEHAPLELNCTATPKKLPATLTRDEKLILKILSFCDKIGYSKKLVSYICRGIAQYHDSIGKPIQSESLSEIGRTLLEKGLIEEFSAFSYKNVDSYLQEAGNLKPDEVDYAVGISKLGQFYGRCYRLNRGRNPLLRWGYFSCRCFAYAAKLNEEIKGIIKLNYESVLSEMRKNAMDMSDYERYYNTIRAFMEEYKEPNNPWIWYDYLHCESIIHPSIKVLRDIEHVLTDVISMLDNSDLKRTDLYIQFIRLSAEIEFELDYPDVIKKAENRIIQYSIHEETGIAWEQYLSTIVNIAIGEKEYDLAKEYLNKYKERNVYDNPYHQVISTALESELKIVQYGEDKGINLKEILPAISNVFFLAQNTLRDYRAQGWIVGLWGECQVLLKDQNGEGNILKSIEHRKISKEKTKSYCNWLSRVATYELTEETNKAIIAELNRICENKIS